VTSGVTIGFKRISLLLRQEGVLIPRYFLETMRAACVLILKQLTSTAGLPDVLQRKGPNVFTNWSKLGPNLQFFWP